MSQVSQVDITPQHTYQIIPLLGSQVISLGTADELDTKFKKLFAFYKQVWGKTGFEKYERIDVQYEGQVVAVKRGAVLPSADSTLEVAGGMANLAREVRDSLRPVATSRVQTTTVTHPSAQSRRHAQAASPAPGIPGQKPGKHSGPVKPPAKLGKGKKPKKGAQQVRRSR
jgi:cell division protein FtsQ